MTRQYAARVDVWRLTMSRFNVPGAVSCHRKSRACPQGQDCQEEGRACFPFG
ncbi:MAG TPA: hypothetical protein DDW22_03220 [Prevotellaceae bacterium]|nr:hypothetical protein [Prevotellaceae bacterium]